MLKRLYRFFFPEPKITVLSCGCQYFHGEYIPMVYKPCRACWMKDRGLMRPQPVKQESDTRDFLGYCFAS